MSYSVTVKNSGHRFEVDAEESILDAALRHGYGFPYSCRTGACKSCKGTVLEGRFHYPEGVPIALSEDERERGQALFCQAIPESDLVVTIHEVEAVRNIPVRQLPARVQLKELLADDVMRLFLKLPKDQRLQYLAGQYLDILHTGGKRRSFSIANGPRVSDLIELHVRHVGGGDFTHWVFHEMPERAVVRFEGPLGTFFVREHSTRPILMMGGGTGFAPLKAMIEELIHGGSERPIHLYWGVRARRDLYMDELPSRWADEHAHLSYTPVLSEPDAHDQWEGRVGLVHEALLADYPDLSAYEVYMSGPPPMIDAAREAFLSHGLAEERLYYDSFDFAPDTQAQILRDSRC